MTTIDCELAGFEEITELSGDDPEFGLASIELLFEAARIYTELLENAAQRAEDNDRKTVQARDL